MNSIPSNDALQLSREEMRALGYKVIDRLVEHFENLRDKPVGRRVDRLMLEERLRESLPEQGTEVEIVLEQLQQDVFNNILYPAHPRFFAGIPSPSNFVSVMADALASGFNVFTGLWRVGPGAVEVELITIDWLRQLCGLPETAGGLFVSGGTAANLTALATARHTRLKDQLKDGIAYCSDQTHPAIARSLRVLGFAPHQLRQFPSDTGFRLPLPELEREVAANRAAGKVPFCVVANVGTASTGAVDPLADLADFCREEGLWLHVDGAHGAAAILCNQGRSLLKGLERVDSLAINPHKWLFQPFEIGCVLVRDSHQLKETFRIHREYLKLTDRAEEVNFCDYGIQLTRGFQALKLWMSLKVFGLNAFRKAIARGIALAELAEKVLRESPCWEIVTPAQMGIVTFRYVPLSRSSAEVDAINRQLVEDMNVDAFAMVGLAVLKGRIALRVCTINPRTTEADIRETIHRLKRLGDELSP
jgi:aromatic-L-amino-acid decarboxylase